MRESGRPLNRGSKLIRWIAICILVDLSTTMAGEPTASKVDFARDILPLLRDRCFECHAGRDASSGVRLDRKENLLGETDGVTVVRPGRASESSLIERITSSDDDQRMPPPGDGEPLSDTDVALLRQWIDQGLDWDEPAAGANSNSNSVAAESADHWAFRAVERARLPTVQRPELATNAVDRFLMAKLEQAGVAPSASAPREILVRRLGWQLLGLPPTPEEIQRFVADTSPGAYERLVDRILASPHYGERWGRHWLDVVRFAESQGFVENHNWPHAWKYRDWVVQSLNADKPYDEFVRQQLAGDEMVPYADENLIATGFLSVARLAGEELSCVRQENDMYVDIVNATASSLLGVTMGCAQCHDHKFDPITQRDYYNLQAYFVQGYPGNVVLGGSSVAPELAAVAEQYRQLQLSIRQRVLSEAYQEEPDEIRQVMLLADEQRTPEQESVFRLARARLNIRLAGCNGFRILPEERKQLDELKARMDPQLGSVSQAWAFYSPSSSPHRLTVLPMASNFPLIHDQNNLARRTAYLLRRGDPYTTVFRVTGGPPTVMQSTVMQSTVTQTTVTQTLRDSSQAAAHPQLAPRRLDLAQWILSHRNPLTARVWVNRLWHYHFGRGIVATPGNFGVRGAPPSHPELLDYLAAELIDSGWSTKHIQRLIVLSNAYRQSAELRTDAAAIDPNNELWWRWPSHRVESEVLRDATLAVSGSLQTTMGGPSVPVGQTSSRRSLYLFQRRDQPTDSQLLFDGPTAMSSSCDQRHVSTTALQSLYSLNHDQSLAASTALAQRVKRRAAETGRSPVEQAFLIVLGRSPTGEELRLAADYLAQDDRDCTSAASESRGGSTDSSADVADLAMTRFCQVLLNVSEFYYVP